MGRRDAATRCRRLRRQSVQHRQAVLAGRRSVLAADLSVNRHSDADVSAIEGRFP